MRLRQILTLVLLTLVLTGCRTTHVRYFQDMDTEQVAISMQSVQNITLQPGDRITIIVTSRDAALATIFNNTANYGTTSLRSTHSEVGASGNTGGSTLMYTIDDNGNIDFPTLGSIHVADMSRQEVAAFIKGQVLATGMLKEAVVTVDFAGLYVNVLGDVRSPGRVSIDKDQLTILDIVTRAGDLNITARRDKITVLRQEGNVLKRYFVDITNSEKLFSSPVYYIKQNDIVYVEPNEKRARESTVNGNTFLTASFWMSMVSFMSSMSSIIINLVK